MQISLYQFIWYTSSGQGYPKKIPFLPSFFQVTLPLLILHGEADLVTDPSVSKALYEKAKSSDKKLCLYKDAWHSLLEGEPDDAIYNLYFNLLFTEILL